MATPKLHTIVFRLESFVQNNNNALATVQHVKRSGYAVLQYACQGMPIQTLGVDGAVIRSPNVCMHFMKLYSRHMIANDKALKKRKKK